ncbi:hypothetical protein QTP70_017772 [Hemibagrus guttatus]|uniref:Uncharacterized protein n=1 Tax=Hemibagrus guttatus TaxID=175788 RepID=A0AAE0QLM0_9TELE|nr:hypothetical protein QTP70_017772 [Hemibagrus guttatus]
MVLFWAYEIVESAYSEVAIVSQQDLNDFYPLASYKVDGKLMDTDALRPCTKGMKMGILKVVNDCTAHSGSNSTVVSVVVVLEEEVAMDNLGDFIKAFILLFGLLYALNIEYPKDLRYTFEAVQKIFVNLGSECTASVQSLKNKLLQL